MADTTVTVKFRADTSDVQTKLDGLQKKMQDTESKLTSMGQSMQSVGKKLSLGLTTPLVGLGVAAAKTAMDFETSLSKMVGLVGLTTDEVDGMRDSVLALSGETAKAPQELADAMFVVTSAGLRGSDALDALESAAKASTAGLGDTADIARSVAGAMNAYGPATLDAAKATDVIVATARAGNFETSQFAAAIGRVLPFAKQAGSSIEDMGGAVALLTRTNGDAAQSVTQVAALFRSFVVPTEEAKKALEAVGLSAGDMRKAISEQGLPAALTMLDQKLGGNREQLGRLLGSSEAASAAFQILDADAESIAGTFGVVGDSVGMTDEAFGAAAETAGFKMQQALTTLKIALIEIGDVILPVLSTFTELLSGVLQRFNALNPTIKTAAVILGAVAAALGPILWVGGKVVATIGTMAGAWASLTARVVSATTSIKTRVRTLELEIKAAMIKSRTQLGALGAAAGVVGKKVIASFRAIAVAAKGLIASFGPIGIVLTAATVAFEIFMGQSADTEATVAELKDTVDKTTGAFTDLSAAMLAEKLTMQLDPGTVQLLDTVGIGVDEMTAALLEGGDAVDEIGQRFNDIITPIERANAAIGNPTPLITAERNFGGLAKQVDETRRQMESQELAQEYAADAVAATGVAALDTAEDFGELEGAVADTQDQMKMLNDMFTTFDKNVAMIRARDEATAYMKTIDENLAKTSRALDGESKAALKNRDAVLGAFERKRTELTTWAAATGATAEEVSARWFEMTQDVRRQLIDEGFDSADLAKFLGSEGIDVASVQVSRELIGAVGTMADRLGPAANREFYGVGRDIGSGLSSGIASKYTDVENETRAMINRAEQAARDAAESRSPSKVFQRIGEDLMAGLNLGIEGNATRIKELGKRLVDQLSSSIESGEEKIAAVARRVFVEWYREVRDDLKANLDDAVQLYDDFAESIQSSLMRGVDLGGAFKGQFNEAGEATGVSLLEGFRNQVKQVEWAGNVYQAIRAQALEGGASQQATDALLQALAAEGPAIGGALGQQILNQGLAATMANEYQAVIDATRLVGEALMPEHLAIGRNNAQAEYNAWVERMGPGGDLRQQFLTDWRNVGVSTSQADYEGMRDALKKGGPVGDAIMNLFNRLGGRSATSTASKFSTDMAGSEGNRMRSAMDALAASLNRTATVTITTVHRSVYESSGLPGRAMGGPVSAQQAYVVGERGPEVFVPDLAGNIIPNNMLGSIPSTMTGGSAGGMAGGSGSTINLTVNAGMGADGAEVGRQVVEAIRKYERRSGPVFASA